MGSAAERRRGRRQANGYGETDHEMPVLRDRMDARKIGEQADGVSVLRREPFIEILLW